MNDGRANRLIKIASFHANFALDKERKLFNLGTLARSLKIAGFEDIVFVKTEWRITSGRLTQLTGKNTNATILYFKYPPKLGGKRLAGDWGEACKSLVLLRFHRRQQSAPNQRNFITAVAYIAHAANDFGQVLLTLTPEALDTACRLITSHYSESTAYNLHKAVAEFAAHCDANELCNCLFQYKYSRMRRPEMVGGLSQLRLDDPDVSLTSNPKMVEPKVFKIIGELYQNVPREHAHRSYVLMLTLLCCLGRRFSEVSLLPLQDVAQHVGNRPFIKYFPRKKSKGDTFTPFRELYLPTDVVPIVKDVLDELKTQCAAARETAAEAFRTGGDVDLRFLNNIDDWKKLTKRDLVALGISPNILNTGHWFSRSGHTKRDDNTCRSSYTTKEHLAIYCRKNSPRNSSTPIHIDQFGKEYFLHDLLIVRYLGLSSGAYSRWSATQCTHSMMTTFLRKFPELASAYASSSVEVDFTSHHFRHTLNTLLDEGGLSDLLQTEWFGRSDPRDTKAYQHTSPAKRALMIRDDLKSGCVGGKLASQLKYVPIDVLDGFLAARVSAVHDVGTGLCVHNFVQTPCERHLQCSAECGDYLWVKGDTGRLEEVKRQYAITFQARKTAEKINHSNRPKRSVDWMAHNDKKLRTLRQQLLDNGVTDFDPEIYLQGLDNGKKI
ncbi:hypothetical protein [Collimonas fungivorans]|uniref:hypothetical protein n=1 Tax=Collimonas fungivorans TaxID=158899 RepID=UPI003FA3A3CA